MPVCPALFYHKYQGLIQILLLSWFLDLIILDLFPDVFYAFYIRRVVEPIDFSFCVRKP